MEYKILDVNKGNEWTNGFGTFQSYTLALEGYGEPVSLNRKSPVSPENEPKAGDTLFGSIEVKHNKNGNEYSTFKTEKQPEGQHTAQIGSSWYESPDKQDSIQRSVALNDAALIYQGSGEATSTILQLANDFYEWLKNEEKVNLNANPLVDKIFPKDEENHEG